MYRPGRLVDPRHSAALPTADYIRVLPEACSSTGQWNAGLTSRREDEGSASNMGNARTAKGDAKLEVANNDLPSNALVRWRGPSSEGTGSRPESSLAHGSARTPVGRFEMITRGERACLGVLGGDGPGRVGRHHYGVLRSRRRPAQSTASPHAGTSPPRPANTSAGPRKSAVRSVRQNDPRTKSSARPHTSMPVGSEDGQNRRSDPIANWSHCFSEPTVCRQCPYGRVSLVSEHATAAHAHETILGAGLQAHGTPTVGNVDRGAVLPL